MVSDVNKQAFSDRLSRIDRKSVPGGRVHRRVGKDGLVETVIVKKRGLVPYRTIIISIGLLIVTKGFILSEIGQTAYDDNLETMKNGSVVAIAAAFLLDDDRATIAVANAISGLRQKY